MGTIKIHQSEGHAHCFKRQDFEISYWDRQNVAAEKLTGGRGASRKVFIDDEPYVLRRYLRGGMIARLLHDRYLWTGASKTRPHLEQMVVEFALQCGLPVPQIAAYCVERSGLFYRAAIISRFIENKGTLASILQEQVLPEEEWASLGQLIKRFHDQGIYHDDLNANNILLTDHNNYTLIDFDKAQIRPAVKDWQQGNLNRLLRSLNKIQASKKQLDQVFTFEQSDWQALLRGYNQA